MLSYFATIFQSFHTNASTALALMEKDDAIYCHLFLTVSAITVSWVILPVLYQMLK